jgi:hypothetical protein
MVNLQNGSIGEGLSLSYYTETGPGKPKFHKKRPLPTKWAQEIPGLKSQRI